MISTLVLAAALTAQFGHAPQAPPIEHYMPMGGVRFESPGGHYATSQYNLPTYTPPWYPLNYRTPIGTTLPLPPGWVFSAQIPAPSRARMLAARTEPN